MRGRSGTAIMYPEGNRVAIGTRRWTVSSWLTSAEWLERRKADQARGETTELDHDADLVEVFDGYPTRAAAERRGHELLAHERQAFGSAILQEEVAVWLVREHGTGEWSEVGPAVELTMEDVGAIRP